MTRIISMGLLRAFGYCTGDMLERRFLLRAVHRLREEYSGLVSVEAYLFRNRRTDTCRRLEHFSIRTRLESRWPYSFCRAAKHDAYEQAFGLSPLSKISAWLLCRKERIFDVSPYLCIFRSFSSTLISWLFRVLSWSTYRNHHFVFSEHPRVWNTSQAKCDISRFAENVSVSLWPFLRVAIVVRTRCTFGFFSIASRQLSRVLSFDTLDLLGHGTFYSSCLFHRVWIGLKKTNTVVTIACSDYIASYLYDMAFNLSSQETTMVRTGDYL